MQKTVRLDKLLVLLALKRNYRKIAALLDHALNNGLKDGDTHYTINSDDGHKHYGDIQ